MSGDAGGTNKIRTDARELREVSGRACEAGWEKRSAVKELFGGSELHLTTRYKRSGGRAQLSCVGSVKGFRREGCHLPAPEDGLR